jgi:predicted alpha/beta superfamily hydrolase/Tfp pilus assembly protein PilF
MNPKITSTSLVLILTLLFNFFPQTSTLAQQDNEGITIGTYRMLHSKILNEDRILLISLPRGYEGSTISYPVVYLLYGDQVKGYFAESVHILDALGESSETPQMILVGVANTERYRDNLPLQRDGSPGGIDKFLKFFIDELIRFIDENYRTKDFRILVGPQAGATFGVFSLTENPNVFNAFILNNPFWIGHTRDFILQRTEAFFDKNKPFNKFLFISYGSYDDQPEAIDYVQKFAQIIEAKNPQNFQFELNRMSEEDRRDFIPSLGLKRGLRSLFHDYKLPEDREVAGLDDIKTYYQRLSEKYGFEVDVPEFVLVLQGVKFSQQRNYAAAQEIFEYLIEIYPTSLNAFIQLGNLHRTLGNFEQALLYYRKFQENRTDSFIQNQIATLERMINESAAYAIEKVLNKYGIETALKKYREIKSNEKNKLYFDESEFNALGYRLLGKGQLKDGIEIFKLNVEMYPQSANVYDSLGEAYMNDGQKELAIQNYEKSLELNPDNANGKMMLKRLLGK